MRKSENNLSGAKNAAVNKIVLGAFILILWIASQFFQASLIPVYEAFDKAVDKFEGGYIIITAFWLIVNNAVRAILLYSGWFMLSDGLAERSGMKKIEWLLPLAAIPLCYFIVSFFHLPSVPHFGVPAFLTLLSVFVLQYISRDITNFVYKMIIQSLLVFSIQWLDLIPLLTDYGFGRGELSLVIKTTTVMMDKDYLLNTICGMSFAFNLCIALILTELFIGYEKRIAQLRVLRLRERELNKLRQEQTTARLYQEMQYLVHDLKRPLTTVLGLADIMAMSKDEATAKHAVTITLVAEKMNMMISEIRSPKSVHETTVSELIKYTMAQVRPLSWGSDVEVAVEDGVGERVIVVNLIRFSRALVNLLDNAHHAVIDVKSPKIFLKAAGGSDCAVISVEDNGPGFLPPQKDSASSWGSSGLGLPFVRNVVSDSGGTIRHEDLKSGGVLCEITIPVKRGETQ